MSASLRLQTRKSGEEPDFRIRRALVPCHGACAHAAPRCGASNRSKIERSPARDSGRGHPLRPERGTARDGASSAVVFGGRVIEMTCATTTLPDPGEVDVSALRARYQEERNRRMRLDGQNQYDTADEIGRASCRERVCQYV